MCRKTKNYISAVGKFLSAFVPIPSAVQLYNNIKGKIMMKCAAAASTLGRTGGRA